MSDLSAAPQAAAPKPIQAKPLKHPGRWVSATILLALFVLFIYSSAVNEAFGWPTYRAYLFDTRIATAALHTLALTVLAMLIGVILGAILAVLRMSPNPVLRGVSWVYLWIFRGTPIYVQLVFWGLLGHIYRSINLGFTEISLEETLKNAFLLAVVGLGLNESAYMAEIVRAGIQAVPEGQIGIKSPGYELVANHAPHGTPPGNAHYYSTDRQRAYLHAENHITGGCRAVLAGTVRAVHGYFLQPVRTHPTADGRRHLVPSNHLDIDGRPVLPGEIL